MLNIRKIPGGFTQCNDSQLPFEVKSKQNTVRIHPCGTAILNTGFADKIRHAEAIELLYNSESNILMFRPTLEYVPGFKKITFKDKERKTQLTCNLRQLAEISDIDLLKIKGKYTPFLAEFVDVSGETQKGYAIQLPKEEIYV